MKRYSVTLLFQFRFHEDTRKIKKRICERRMIIVHAKNAFFALKKANKYGKQAEFTADNYAGKVYSFEFIGITDMLYLYKGFGDEMVWYDMMMKIEPMERKEKLVLSDEDLLKKTCAQ